MSDAKSHQFRPPLYHRDERSRAKRPHAGAQGSRGRPADDSDEKGWEAYRKWLSTVNTRTRSERAPVDRSIYSWKGYHTWADRVKQSWKPDDT